MRYTLLGKTGLRVSEIALGTMGFGAPAWGTSEEVSAEILDRYLEAGGNFIDTADQYSHGSAEFILGAMLDGRRDDVVLAT
ncbi:MAG: aldo/keto reductase, partial [Actinobacteria bacterium]|nr:aldo/keto reductase [Actinomycetota bacterium]